jgi:hypothetical protein
MDVYPWPTCPKTSDPSLFNKVRDHIFGKIVLRCTGRVQHFYDCWYVMHHKNKGNIIPTPSDWEDFIKYMRSTCSKDTSSTCGWRSDQHGGKIPDELKYMISFEKVSRRWIKNLHGLVYDIIKEREKLTNKKPKSHSKEPMNPVRLAILNLFDDFLLKSLRHSDKKNATKPLLGQTRFLSSEIMKDIEEDLEDISGIVLPDSIETGFGFSEGFCLIEELWSIKKATMNQRYCVGMSNFVEWINLQSEVALSIFCCQRREMNEGEWKKLDPYYKQLAESFPGHQAHFDTTGKHLGPVVYKINGRVVNAGDAEHFACKLKILFANTYASRTISEQPKATRHYCHPLPLSDIPWDDAIVGKIMKDSRSTFDSSQDLHLPNVCRMIHELTNEQLHPSNDSNDSNDDSKSESSEEPDSGGGG